MSRARNIKPGFFRNADLVELPVETRLLFIGLWGLADRDGRMADRPKQIKMEIYPADSFDVDAMLAQLAGAGFIERYQVDGIHYLQVVNFSKHQNPHRDEKASILPAPCGHGASTVPIGLNPDSRILIPEPTPAISRSEPLRDDSPPADLDHLPPPTRAGALCLILRPLGVSATPGNPIVIEWANGLSVSDDEAREAVARAREYKPEPQPIPMAYLGSILTSLRSEGGPRPGAPPRKGKQGARDDYNASAAEAAKRLGIDQPGDSNGNTAERDITVESTRIA